MLERRLRLCDAGFGGSCRPAMVRSTAIASRCVISPKATEAARKFRHLRSSIRSPLIQWNDLRQSRILRAPHSDMSSDHCSGDPEYRLHSTLHAWSSLRAHRVARCAADQGRYRPRRHSQYSARRCGHSPTSRLRCSKLSPPGGDRDGERAAAGRNPSASSRSCGSPSTTWSMAS